FGQCPSPGAGGRPQEAARTNSERQTSGERRPATRRGRDHRIRRGHLRAGHEGIRGVDEQVRSPDDDQTPRHGPDPIRQRTVRRRKDLGLATALAESLLAGRNPLATRASDMRLAYRSPVDGTLQPFRVFVPDGYDPSKKYPLIVALHGATG